MEITSEIIKKHFKFERTWDVTKDCPEGSVDEYQFRCQDFVCRLMYHKAKDWEEPHWELDASNLKYPFRNVKVKCLENVEDLANCLVVFITTNKEVKKLYNKLKSE